MKRAITLALLIALAAVTAAAGDGLGQRSARSEGTAWDRSAIQSQLAEYALQLETGSETGINSHD